MEKLKKSVLLFGGFKSLIIFGSILCLLTVARSNVNIAHFARIPKFDGYIISTYNLTMSELAVSTSDCAKRCLKNTECGSFFYYVQDTRKLCQLHSVLFRSTSEAVATPGASYYQLTQDFCPYEDGYVLYRPLRLCYRYISEDVIWTAAKLRCENRQSHLMYVKTPQTMNHIINFLRASPDSRSVQVTIGGFSTDNTDWKWLDNSSMSWTSWGGSEPTTNNELCLAMAWFYNFNWNNVPCDVALRPYLCQLDI